MWYFIERFLWGQAFFILSLFQIVTLILTTYQTVISLIGLLLRNKNAVTPSVSRKFAIAICAHNEEIVIGDILGRLKTLDYPKSMYDVFVIADNCTDSTAKIARDYGVYVYERHDKEKVSKGYGIEWFLARVWEQDLHTKYDALAIFDADNLMSRNFLKMVNGKMDQGARVIQAYLDSKNPKDTWITRSYAFAYWATSQIYQQAREKMGLSAQLGGTGMVFHIDVLKDMGWGTESLTEDLEFTVRYAMLSDQRVHWLHEAKIYDEKPLNMRQSYVQRMRWMKGHFDCAFRYSVPLAKKIRWNRSLFIYLDLMIYLIQPIKIVLAMAGLVFFIISLFRPIPEPIMTYVLNPWVWWTVLSIYYLQPLYALFLEKKAKTLWWFIPSYIFSLSWIPIVAYAVFNTKEKTWTHTTHTRSVLLEETQEDL